MITCIIKRPSYNAIFMALFAKCPLSSKICLPNQHITRKKIDIFSNLQTKSTTIFFLILYRNSLVFIITNLQYFVGFET